MNTDESITARLDALEAREQARDAERELLLALAKLSLPHPAERQPEPGSPLSERRWQVKELLGQITTGEGCASLTEIAPPPPAAAPDVIERVRACLQAIVLRCDLNADRGLTYAVSQAKDALRLLGDAP